MHLGVNVNNTVPLSKFEQFLAQEMYHILRWPAQILVHFLRWKLLEFAQREVSGDYDCTPHPPLLQTIKVFQNQMHTWIE